MNHYHSEMQAQKYISQLNSLIKENNILRQEIRVAREASEITANLVVKQFEKSEKILHRFQRANEQRNAVLDSATQFSIIATDIKGIILSYNFIYQFMN